MHFEFEDTYSSNFAIRKFKPICIELANALQLNITIRSFVVKFNNDNYRRFCELIYDWNIEKVQSGVQDRSSLAKKWTAPVRSFATLRIPGYDTFCTIHQPYPEFTITTEIQLRKTSEGLLLNCL